MKKVFCTLAAIVITAVCGQPASAWINSQFGLGLNWNYASGGNSFLCGAFRNSQPGAPEMIHNCTRTPVYPQPACCVAGQATTVTTPQVVCPPGVPAPGYGAAPAAHHPAAAATQSLRYPTYRPQPAAPTYGYPANYYRGY